MTADLELRLGRVASLAHRARVTISRGCLASDPDECVDDDCGGHAAVGWSLDPHTVLAAVYHPLIDRPTTVIDLVVEHDRLADAVSALVDGYRALTELDGHVGCDICDRRPRGCSEFRDLRKRVDAARELSLKFPAGNFDLESRRDP